MQHDFNKLTEEFINKYGHLRPNTYEISSKNYRENFNNYFQKIKKNLKKIKYSI